MCKLDKSLYGLKQAPRAWFSKLSTRLEELGFAPSQGETSLFIYNQCGITIYVLIYVDDIVIASSSNQAVEKLLKQLHKDFALKDLGMLHYFLGIEVIQKKDGIVLNQKRYIGDILSRANMSNCKPISTPLASSERLSKTEGVALIEEKGSKYRSIVGALQYLTIIRHDIAFSVNKVC